MPAKWFICPDKKQVEITKCLSPNGCRMSDRCLTMATLRACAYDREFRGITPSAAGNGIRLIWLKAIMDYAIDPQARAWSLAGSNLHAKLSLGYYAKDCLSEEKLSDEKTKGIADVLELDEKITAENGGKECYLLYDYKNWGSFKVAKTLGLISSRKIPDPSGAVYKSSGKWGKKGSPKMVQTWEIDPTKADQIDVALQLNRYRILFESYGFPISQIKVEAIVRDGNSVVAFNRGINRNMYIIPIRRLDDDFVLRYYDSMQKQIDLAFQDNFAPVCSPNTTWNGRRCEAYCEVAPYCKLLNEGKELPSEYRTAKG